ncbi:sensor histidine kinase [Bradyrhizobium sp. RD5-C2]|uniref:sensor histidine kinase n=1 Tax=Bradyrhizobium sp. RD5-C2 TaxID=244562 RepID=UPI001CC5E860|nr:HAMP domain-containing sensor histidine kinase [Bradyrhizobium sp. RD5-C2]GIQ77750.1 hypothetical protein BraRD5C2_62000 [Bradyrhizobium sp. RD5-C2]
MGKPIRLSGLIILLAILLSPPGLRAQEMRPHSALVLDQSDRGGPFYDQVFVGLRDAVSAHGHAPTTVDTESLDFSRFGREAYQNGFRREAALQLAADAALPQGSESRLREPGFIERYRWRAIALAAAILAQTLLIAFLLHERHMRRKAEVESRNQLSQLAHVNRQATAGELSSSIAHELNQPLGSILTNAETAELILASPTPDLQEVREIISDIKRDDLRASEVIRRMRSLLKRAPFEKKEIDLNQTMREAFDFLKLQASARNVAIYLQTSPETLRVTGDPVQLQQVILNLVVNSMDAMAKMPYGRTIIGRTEVNGDALAMISICDSGPGIPQDRLNDIFDPFFTTKEQGMGIGLSIARTIVLAHSGQIWAENQSGGGAAFHLSLPLAA